MSANSTLVKFDEFLARDFAGIGAGTIDRCLKIDGSRLYIAGATGFFGKNILSLLTHLQRRGASFKVTALSRSPERFLEKQPWCRDLPWLQWRQADVTEPWPGEGNYDYMIHAATDTAASAHVDKLNLFEQVVTGTRRSLDFAIRHRVTRVLLCGSGAQYGAIPRNFAAGVTESSMLACDSTKANSAYGEGKRAGEILAALYGAKHGFEVVNTRCFAFLGPGLPLDGHFAIGNFIRDALGSMPIKLATTGHSVRSYLYGADLAVWLLVLLLEAENGAAINVGSDRAIRIIDLAKRVRDIVNADISVHPGEDSSDGERNLYVPSIDSAKALGLDAWTDLDRAIARTAEWHRSGAL
jgi:nucleoside-diphosphate-sugar epimerase